MTLDAKSSVQRQSHSILRETLSEHISTNLKELHNWLRLQLMATHGIHEATRLMDGAKDAAVEFLDAKGHTPGSMGKYFDYRAELILECLFIQNPELMGPDGTEQEGEDEDEASPGPRSNKADIETASGHVGLRRVREHILSAFMSLPVGSVLLIREITLHKSKEYGREAPSAGAISAVLFPDRNNPSDGSKCTIPGIQGVLMLGGRKGAIKLQ